MKDKGLNTARCIADYVENVTNCHALVYGSRNMNANCSKEQFQQFRDLQHQFSLADEQEIYQVYFPLLYLCLIKGFTISPNIWRAAEAKCI
jgi:hypothetical protein